MKLPVKTAPRYKSNILKWSWSNTINIYSALLILMAWCFIYKASAAIVLPMHLCISSWPMKRIFADLLLHFVSLLNTDTAGFNCKQLRAVSIQRCCLVNIGCPIIKIRLSHNHLIFIIEIHIPEKMVFILKQSQTPLYTTSNTAVTMMKYVFEKRISSPCSLYSIWQWAQISFEIVYLYK